MTPLARGKRAQRNLSDALLNISLLWPVHRPTFFAKRASAWEPSYPKVCLCGIDTGSRFTAWIITKTFTFMSESGWTAKNPVRCIISECLTSSTLWAERRPGQRTFEQLCRRNLSSLDAYAPSIMKSKATSTLQPSCELALTCAKKCVNLATWLCLDLENKNIHSPWVTTCQRFFRLSCSLLWGPCDKFTPEMKVHPAESIQRILHSDAELSLDARVFLRWASLKHRPQIHHDNYAHLIQFAEITSALPVTTSLDDGCPKENPKCISHTRM